MVNGLDTFAEAFRPFRSQYVLIGGSACDWIGEPYDTVPLVIREPYPEVLGRIRDRFVNL